MTYLYNFIYKFSWLAITSLCLLLFSITIIYLNFKPDVNFLLTKQSLVHHPIWIKVFYIHIISAMIVIFIGPFQFIQSLRRKYIKLHKLLGKMYVFLILFLAAPSGIYMSFYANGGVYASIGFLIMGILWFYTTYMAFYRIIKKDVKAHIKWMIRSFALSLAAVTLRLLVPILSLGFDMEHQFIVVITAWLSWIINIIIAECIIYLHPPSLTI